VPIFEYHCPACDHRFEKIQKSSSSRPAACPRCGAVARRLLSAPAIQFKGTGWYITDYARKKGFGPGSDKGSGETSGENKGDAGSQSNSDSSAAGGKGEKGEKTEKRDKADKPTAPPAAPAKGSRGKKRD